LTALTTHIFNPVMRLFAGSLPGLALLTRRYATYRNRALPLVQDLVASRANTRFEGDSPTPTTPVSLPRD
jgi:hypothetical protein